uniref:Uncharacterized protein n=1 Tax=Nelumbo nucifera TaxID=4432 RepID=A0A822Z1T7_NELNU|nr:TPA_asm: hypothetical protein HUJ06_014707 [Nelumbo nucifera]
MLDYGFAKVADLMVKYTIAPIVSNSCPAVSVEQLDQDSGRIIEAILKLVPSSNSQVNLVIVPSSAFCCMHLKRPIMFSE